MNRKAGVLMPIFSLPSKYGIGCFDQAAYDFVDYLTEAGQTYWQILPLSPTSFGKIRQLTLSVLFSIRRQPIFHQSGCAGGGRCADGI